MRFQNLRKNCLDKLALDGWVVDDTFVLVDSEGSFRGVEDDEHIVPGVGYDRAEAYLDLERTPEELDASIFCPPN